MTDQEPAATVTARPFTLYSLRIVPLWDGEAECIELGSNLQEIIGTIVRDRSVGSLVGKEIKPMRFCQLEQEDAITLMPTQQIFYARERTPVWKVMVPVSGIYSRAMIVSCMDRGTARNIEKYRNVLFNHPQATQFYTYSTNEIRPVDTSVFVIEHPGR